MMKSLKLTVEGLVQGVGYRWFVENAAREMDITGTVKNLMNGNVQVVAQGKPDNLAEFVSILREGPSFAHVTAIETTELENAAIHRDFRIIF
ncbi:MAG: acylphosphatase [Candidatus Cloacimonetes bacterium]|nr:acylphosphatase [Candidatus Cloacimonadota bacterium]